MKPSSLQRILEIYRSSQYRTTGSGRKVRWDEPGEDDTSEVQQHNAFLARRLKQKQDAKERLKSKGAVPSRNGKPIFEGSGDVQQFALSFRRHYYSSRPMRFKEWIEVVAELLNDLWGLFVYDS